MRQAWSFLKRYTWESEKSRLILYQILLVVLAVFFVNDIVQNTLANLESRGIPLGFDFLQKPASFAVGQSLIELNYQSSFGRMYFIGLLNTLLASALGILIATFLGVFIGICSVSQNWLLKKSASFYIELLRNIPILLQLIFWYFLFTKLAPSAKESIAIGESIFISKKSVSIAYIDLTGYGWALLSIFVVSVFASYAYKKWATQKWYQTGNYIPQVLPILAIVIVPLVLFVLIFLDSERIHYPELSRFGFVNGINMIPELTVLAFGLGIYTATYIAEAVRSGIRAVDSGQHEAAYSVALNQNVIFKTIILPQALRVAIPPITSQYLNLIKNSSLGIAIGYPDLVSVFSGTSLNIVGQAIEIMFITMLTYLAMSLLVSLVMNMFNKKFNFAS